MSDPRFSREAIVTAMSAAGLVKPIVILCRAADSRIYYDLVAGEAGRRKRERVPIEGDEDAFQVAIDKLAAAPQQNA